MCMVMIIIILFELYNQINNMGSKINLSAIFGAGVVAISTSLNACNSTPTQII